jgi:hypothetical protein
MSTVIYHNHHIIPKYRCKEMGIDPDFEGNTIRLTRLEHADAHYQRWLKHKDPRDLGAAQLLAEGEIDQLPSPSGKNSPRWGIKASEETKAKQRKIRALQVITPETKKKISETMKGRPSHRKGKTGIWSEETLKKWSEIRKGKKHSAEHRKNMCGKIPWNKGKKMPEETKKKISETKLKGKNADIRL